ncbi:MAG: B-glycosyltransferase, glycosyltransferase family 2 protein [Candidatus Gottesmanbacteria bacterium GW2011_GWC2_39_8]|uniref:B-glycosyltransferase, glycosyltransferase family 2 protein n=1 Tax=Candidatus Gottesmanbacteria bacterium GW2011_GWC2_39_8 TaxID=1618450 RepID=A0A0G0T3D3_9BACT|nr:MAG: B-glycosyltransferase, glycosyltransferase family 2 protein [Candidatus Gottesmanbacteria bacterium GW2011_GWC2_39_8]
MPAYNAEKTIEKTYRDIPKNSVDEVIVVDDGSRDETVKIAKKLGLRVFIHEKNLGYGGNQKTCYKEALKSGADIVVMIHPDYQYDATLTADLIKPIIENRFDIMLGSRIRSRKEALAGGMPLYKYISNRFLTVLENIVLGLNLSEYHTGFRAFSKEVLQKLPLENFSNDFVFDQEILISAHVAGYTMGEIAVPVRYFPEASSINFRRSTRYGITILYTLLLFILNNLGIKNKIFQFRK